MPSKPPPPKQSSKIGMTSLGNRAYAPLDEASTQVSASRGQATTYFTKVPGVGEDTPVIYNADRQWAQVTLTLETAGPVAVGFLSRITPVLGGSGQLLETGKPSTFNVPQGAKLYIAATAVNRVKLSIQPYAWVEQMTAYIRAIVFGERPKR